MTQVYLHLQVLAHFWVLWGFEQISQALWLFDWLDEDNQGNNHFLWLLWPSPSLIFQAFGDFNISGPGSEQSWVNSESAQVQHDDFAHAADGAALPPHQARAEHTNDLRPTCGRLSFSGGEELTP